MRGVPARHGEGVPVPAQGRVGEQGPGVPAGPVAEAHQAADAVAGRSGLRVVELCDTAELHAAGELLRRVWRADSPDQLVSAGMMRALVHSGNYLVGAYRDRRLVGVAVGFFGADHLHSHIAGVDQRQQSAGVGYALKLHQRAWALDRGISTVGWTFDPLVRRNAYFNLQKLGARATGYLPDFYGPMDDGVNAGDASDRIYISWDLVDSRAVSAARGHAADVDLAAVTAAGAHLLLDRAAGETPVPRSLPADPRPLLVAVPADVELLRGHDAALARRWRHAVREALLGALAEGYRITGLAREGWYLLEATT